MIGRYILLYVCLQGKIFLDSRFIFKPLLGIYSSIQISLLLKVPGFYFYFNFLLVKSVYISLPVNTDLLYTK